MRTFTSRIATAEARAARRWYRQRSERAARDFQTQLVRVRDRIRLFPESGTPLGDGYRAARFDQFPFAVVYRITSERVEIVAIAHAKREPGYWLGR